MPTPPPAPRSVQAQPPAQCSVLRPPRRYGWGRGPWDSSKSVGQVTARPGREPYAVGCCEFPQVVLRALLFFHLPVLPLGALVPSLKGWTAGRGRGLPCFTLPADLFHFEEGTSRVVQPATPPDCGVPLHVSPLAF